MIPFKIGDAFAHVTFEKAIELLEKEQKLGETELQKVELTVKRQRLVRNVLIAGFILVFITLIILI